MKTHSGILILGKREREALEVLKHHTLSNISWGEGGSFNKEVKGEFLFDKAEAKKAELGLEVIDFVLQITK